MFFQYITLLDGIKKYLYNCSFTNGTISLPWWDWKTLCEVRQEIPVEECD